MVKSALLLICLVIISLCFAPQSLAKILNKELVKKATLEFGMRGEFCKLTDPANAQFYIDPSREIDLSKIDDPHPSTEITSSQCSTTKKEILFGLVRLDYHANYDAPPGYHQLFILDDQILRADSFFFEYYANFQQPESFTMTDFLRGKMPGQRAITASTFLLTDPALPDGQTLIEDSGYVMSFDKNGDMSQLILAYKGSAYLLTNLLKEVERDIVLVDYTDQLTPTPAAQSTEGWKTYEGNGFSFGYPEDITELQDSILIQHKETLNSSAPDGYEQSPGYTIDFQRLKPTNDSLMEFVTKHIQTRSDKNEIELAISTFNGYSSIAFKTFGSGHQVNHIFLKSDAEDILKITYSINDINKKGYEETVNLILSTVQFLSTTPTPPTISQKCVVGGCSGQICQSADEEPMMTTCEYKEEYACYKKSTCEAQSDGTCGWTMNDELKSCLNESK